ncbi:MAG: hypothetical protein PHE27_05205 [Alphaproteobacteria bacterium]|nr:hypothetical protein [Alphaproteobacteria bacterium]
MSPPNKKTARTLLNAPKLVVATIALMEELTQVLVSEGELVTQRRMDEHAALLKRKQRLAMDYRANIKSIAAQPELLKTLPDDAKAAIKDIARRLAFAVDSNARMLRGAVDATRQLVQNVMAMVRSEALPRQTYKNHTKAHLQLGTYSPKCKAVAFSKTI